MRSAVLILAWNRPDKLSRLVERLKELQVPNIYIWRDGPRVDSNHDFINCRKVEEIANSNFDWNCTLKKRISSVNLGCEQSVRSAIDWFFEFEDEGIIIEDDCLPNEDFFAFCDSLLDTYRSDNRIWTVSGSNFQNGKVRGSASYYFSRYCHSWGWATWKDRWRHYADNKKYWKDYFHEERVYDMSNSEWFYWRKVFDRLYLKNQPDSWALRWLMTCFANQGLTAIPNVNLVLNIGFDKSATHTKGYSQLAARAYALGNIIHPVDVVVNKDADLYTYNEVYNQPFFSMLRRRVYGYIDRLSSHV